VSFYLAEQASLHGVTTFMDLDLRPDQWSHPSAFGLRLRRALPLCDVIIGTEEEFYAALSPTPEAVMAGESVSDSESLHHLMRDCAGERDATLVLKRGDRGARLYTNGSQTDVPGFPVQIVNTVGAGDGFASGLIYGWARGWAWEEAARFANACGALVVSRHGCARALPYLREVEAFISDGGNNA